MTDYKLTRTERIVNAFFYGLTHLLVRIEADYLYNVAALETPAIDGFR